MDKKMKRQTESEEAYRKSSGDRSGHGRDLIPRNRMTAISRSARSKALAQLPWRQLVEPWYFIYALQGIVIGGMAPMLLPLAVVRAGSPLYVGLVMAAFSLGGLTAPLWGRVTECLGWPRWLLIGGFLLTAFGLVAFAFTTAPIVWVALALLQGSGAARATTMANSFIVEARPQEQWEQRMGWLQTFYGGGQVAGLLLTGLLVQADVRTGLLVAAAFECNSRFLSHSGYAALFSFADIRANADLAASAQRMDARIHGVPCTWPAAASVTAVWPAVLRRSGSSLLRG